MNLTPTAIPDVILVEPHVISDDRGFFMETYREQVFADAGIRVAFVQDNHSGSARGVLRGLHYQVRQPQGKLVKVVVGEVFDVAVDLRRSSPSFGQWVAATLSAANRLELWIPPGFAHGFYTLSEWAEMIYKVTDGYSPESDRTLLWNDPKLGIQWPLTEPGPPILSVKDARGRTLAEAECFE